jgi:hypothetical protein
LTGQKTITATAVILAILSAFLLVGASYILFPDQTSQEPPIPMPIPKPEPLAEQIVWALGWIGLAAGIASAVVAAMLLVSRIRTRNSPKQ